MPLTMEKYKYWLEVIEVYLYPATLNLKTFYLRSFFYSTVYAFYSNVTTLRSGICRR